MSSSSSLPSTCFCSANQHYCHHPPMVNCDTCGNSTHQALMDRLPTVGMYSLFNNSSSDAVRPLLADGGDVFTIHMCKFCLLNSNIVSKATEVYFFLQRLAFVHGSLTIITSELKSSILNSVFQLDHSTHRHPSEDKDVSTTFINMTLGSKELYEHLMRRDKNKNHHDDMLSKEGVGEEDYVDEHGEESKAIVVSVAESVLGDDGDDNDVFDNDVFDNDVNDFDDDNRDCLYTTITNSQMDMLEDRESKW